MTALLAPPTITAEPAEPAPLVVEVGALPVFDMVPCWTCGVPCLKDFCPPHQAARIDNRGTVEELS